MARCTNPFRRFKDSRGITYAVMGDVLGISEDYAKKLGAGLLTSVSPATAKLIEERSGGAISFAQIMRWAEANLGGNAA